MGIAVHSGAVVAGNIGSQDRMKYGVVGPPVNLTGRIESLTIGAQILLSDATLARVRHVVTVGAGIQVAVKGVPEPVTVYELTGVTGEARDRLARRSGRPGGGRPPRGRARRRRGEAHRRDPPSGPGDAHRSRGGRARRERHAAREPSGPESDRRFRRRRRAPAGATCGSRHAGPRIGPGGPAPWSGPCSRPLMRRTSRTSNVCSGPRPQKPVPAKRRPRG